MPVDCPNCLRKLQLPAACIGASVRCPVCAAVFEAPAAMASAGVPRRRNLGGSATVARAGQAVPRSEQPPAVSRSGSLEGGPAWRRYRLGLDCLRWGLLGQMVALGLGLILSLVMCEMVRRRAFPPTPGILDLGAWGIVVLQLASDSCNIAGLVIWWLYPVPRQGRAVCTAALVLISLLVLLRTLVPWLLYDAGFLNQGWNEQAVNTILAWYLLQALLYIQIARTSKVLGDGRTGLQFSLLLWAHLAILGLIVFVHNVFIPLSTMFSSVITQHSWHAYTRFIPFEMAVAHLGGLLLAVQQERCLYVVRSAVEDQAEGRDVFLEDESAGMA